MNQSKSGDFTCSDCDATFAKVQGLNAHKAHCKAIKIIQPVDVTVMTGGTNGKH